MTRRVHTSRYPTIHDCDVCGAPAVGITMRLEEKPRMPDTPACVQTGDIARDCIFACEAHVYEEEGES